MIIVKGIFASRIWTVDWNTFEAIDPSRWKEKQKCPRNSFLSFRLHWIKSEKFWFWQINDSKFCFFSSFVQRLPRSCRFSCCRNALFSGSAICTTPRKLSQISGNLEIAQSYRNPFCCHRELLEIVRSFPPNSSCLLLNEKEMSIIFWRWWDILPVRQCEASQWGVLINFLGTFPK